MSSLSNLFKAPISAISGGGTGGGMTGGMGGGSKPSGMSMGSLGGNYDYSLGLPLSKETESTYGGAKPGKAPTQKTPAPPDPFKLIEEQAKVNRTNEIGPSGSTINYKDPITGVWTQKREFSPELKELYNKQINLLNTPLAAPPSTELTTGTPRQISDFTPRDFSADSTRMEQATFERQKGLLDPLFKNRENDLRSMLANKGIMEGSEAWNRDTQDFQRARDEAYNKAALDAVGAGRAEQGRLFGQDIASWGTGATAQQGDINTLQSEIARKQLEQQGYQQQLAGRQSSFNELAALLGGQQVGSPAQLDVMGPFSQQYQGQLQSVRDANANAAQRNASTTSAAATGGAALLAALLSSSSLKENKQPIDHNDTLEKVSALDVETWTYIPGVTGETDRHIGPYAEQFAELFGTGDGIHINAVDAIGVCLSAIKALTAKIERLEAAHG